MIGPVARSIPPTCQTVVVTNAAYSQCGSTWYMPQMQGSSVTYVVVNRRAGIRSPQENPSASQTQLLLACALAAGGCAAPSGGDASAKRRTIETAVDNALAESYTGTVAVLPVRRAAAAIRLPQSAPCSVLSLIHI